MSEKNVDVAMSQFADDATWINSQGYLFEGKGEIQKFHEMLTGRDSIGYHYTVGVPRIRLLDPQNALAYYPWRMDWYRESNPADTINKEVGLMTLTARKEDGRWHWIAVTVQHTPWYSEEIVPVSID